MKAEAIKNPSIILTNPKRYPRIRVMELIGQRCERRRKKDMVMLKEAMKRMAIEKTFVFSVIIFPMASFGQIRTPSPI